MTVFLGMLSVAGSPAVYAQSAQEAAVLASAIAFRFRSEVPMPRIVIDAGHLGARVSPESMERLTGSVRARHGTLKASMTCSKPKHGPHVTLDDCSMPTGLVVVAFKPPKIEAGEAVVELATYEGSEGHGVHIESVELQLTRSPTGWSVTKVLRRGAS